MAFAAALELPAAEQEAFLAREFPRDPQLREEIASMLRGCQAAGAFLEPKPHFGVRPGALAAGPTAPAITEIIGRFRILRLLGEGGMGAVYEAEQDQPRRTFALKLIRPGLTGPEMVRRFEHKVRRPSRAAHGPPGCAESLARPRQRSDAGPAGRDPWNQPGAGRLRARSPCSSARAAPLLAEPARRLSSSYTSGINCSSAIESPWLQRRSRLVISPIRTQHSAAQTLLSSVRLPLRCLVTELICPNVWRYGVWLGRRPWRFGRRCRAPEQSPQLRPLAPP
jgi:hypothetical protein